MNPSHDLDELAGRLDELTKRLVALNAARHAARAELATSAGFEVRIEQVRANLDRARESTSRANATLDRMELGSERRRDHLRLVES